MSYHVGPDGSGSWLPATGMSELLQAAATEEEVKHTLQGKYTSSLCDAAHSTFTMAMESAGSAPGLYVEATA